MSAWTDFKGLFDPDNYQSAEVQQRAVVTMLALLVLAFAISWALKTTAPDIRTLRPKFDPAALPPPPAA